MSLRHLALLGAALGMLAAALVQSSVAPARATVTGQATLAAGAPGLVSYQGYLEQSAGQPFTGTATLTFRLYEAAAGGSPLWQETQSGVAVSAGYFGVLLGAQTPLDAEDFAGPNRYLEAVVDLGGGPTTLPRQRLAAAPYAFQAQAAASAPWSGLTGVPPGFADGVDDTGADWAGVITVAASGGDFTSVAAALDSIASPSADNRYLVWVAPGTYTESALVRVRPYVHLKGSGPNATVITSARTASSPGEGAATARLDDNGRISDLTIRNTGAGTYGIGVWSAEATRAAAIDGAVVEAVGAGGTGHYAVYLNDAEPAIRDSVLRASGATGFGTGVNAALGVVNVSGGFPQPLVQASSLLGGNVDPHGKTCAGNTGTGFGLQYANAAAEIVDSLVCGDHRAIFGGTNGITRVEGSKLLVSGTTGAFLVETTGAAVVTIANSGVFYATNKHTGAGGLTCVGAYKANYTAASDGTTPATACN
ncbi:MAG TPA: pectinesterase family protein [Chloroflexaceae bacterium]|nr:pectinesterase family protein [Chloroflexaceae bacterium]